MGRGRPAKQVGVALELAVLILDRKGAPKASCRISLGASHVLTRQSPIDEPNMASSVAPKLARRVFTLAEAKKSVGGPANPARLPATKLTANSLTRSRHTGSCRTSLYSTSSPTLPSQYRLYCTNKPVCAVNGNRTLSHRFTPPFAYLQFSLSVS